uniref:Enoyl-CoA hydratase domain-containing protein 3, mitochondrial n=1 Tax=Heterorhabditis bacteriophora TaxID=37862 RepID=A0A1I7XGI7_HETBA
MFARWSVFCRRLCSHSSLLQKEIYQGNTVVRLVLNDPKRRNALSSEMIEQLSNELHGINKISKVRSVVIASEGPSFSSGHDLRELRSDAGSENHQKIFDMCSILMQFIQQMEVPVIAEVSGIATAAGCQLVASCDIAVAADTAKFMVPGQKIGLFCSTPGIALSRAISHKVALDMLLTGEPIDAQSTNIYQDSALRCGLISRIAPINEVKFEALRVAEAIGAHSRSVTSLGKAFFYTQIELNQADAYRYGNRVMVANLKLKDSQEGIKAFIEKRKAQFTHSKEQE